MVERFCGPRGSDTVRRSDRIGGTAAAIRDRARREIANLPGVGENFQDHLSVTQYWESKVPTANTMGPIDAVRAAASSQPPEPAPLPPVPLRRNRSPTSFRWRSPPSTTPSGVSTAHPHRTQGRVHRLFGAHASAGPWLVILRDSRPVVDFARLATRRRRRPATRRPAGPRPRRITDDTRAGRSKNRDDLTDRTG